MTQLAPKKGLPWWAILLIVFACLSVLGGIGIGAIVWWAAANRERIVAEGKQSIADGEQFAANSDQNACLSEGLRKLDRCSGMMCEVQTKIFTKTCMEHATRPPGFCTNVPEPNEIMKTASWVVNECARRGKPGNDRCSRLLQVVPEACHGPS